MGFDAHHGLGVFAVDAEGDGHAAAAVQGVREIEFIDLSDELKVFERLRRRNAVGDEESTEPSFRPSCFRNRDYRYRWL